MNTTTAPDLFTLNEVKAVYTMKNKPLGPQVMTSKTAYDYVIDFWEDIDHVESAYMILLNRANKIIGIKLLSVGGIAGTVIDPKIVLQTALICNASYFILLHNHPSGNLQPSHDDTALTNKIKQAGLFLDLRLIDHLIITSDGYFSYADEGLL
jgi:DNA repair protein RadC